MLTLVVVMLVSGDVVSFGVGSVGGGGGCCWFGGGGDVDVGVGGVGCPGVVYGDGCDVAGRVVLVLLVL